MDGRTDLFWVRRRLGKTRGWRQGRMPYPYPRRTGHISEIEGTSGS